MDKIRKGDINNELITHADISLCPKAYAYIKLSNNDEIHVVD